jgi:hypothetical protein
MVKKQKQIQKIKINMFSLHIFTQLHLNITLQYYITYEFWQKQIE